MSATPAQLFAEISTPQPPTDTQVLMHRAIVLGASMAGLMAARVLSDHAEEVLIVERDDSAAGDQPRPGVPQGTQVHALLPAGQVQLNRWFPGFYEEALEAGAVEPRAEGVQLFINEALRTTPPVRSVDPALVSTRPFLESRVRAKTLAVENIKLVHGRADGLVFTGDRVTGVRYVPVGAEETITETADFVVDATGRSSHLGDWLADNGWERPPMVRMPIKLNYATALFKRDERVSVASAVTSQTSPTADQIARIGGVLAVEGDRWLVLISGYADDRPSRDPEEFKARCRKDFPPVFGQIADNAEMIGGVVTYHQADSRRRDFDQLTRLPAGLVAAGDAVASFNPVYGQGMTSATLHASCLSTYLRSNPPLDQPARSYFEQVRVVVDVAWQISTFNDLELPHVNGPFPRGYKLVKWFTGRIFRASMTDAKINEQLSRVTTMLAHPSVLSRPGTLLRALRLTMFSGA
jgi:2-polyprenyl-6-methoxyphenol hydroxylase-like FAD-dependent oxidoreductase